MVYLARIKALATKSNIIPRGLTALLVPLIPRKRFENIICVCFRYNIYKLRLIETLILVSQRIYKVIIIYVYIEVQFKLKYTAYFYFLYAFSKQSTLLKFDNYLKKVLKQTQTSTNTHKYKGFLMYGT